MSAPKHKPKFMVGQRVRRKDGCIFIVDEILDVGTLGKPTLIVRRRGNPDSVVEELQSEFTPITIKERTR